jgi:ABC-type transport system involved in multi-copper enzyme maturation permease subunit
MLFQVIVLFAILSFVLKPPFSLAMLLVVLLTSSVFILIGMCIGYVSRTAETSVLITIAVILFMLFFSNLVLPVETISSLRQLAVYNPLTISNEMIKSISLLGLGLEFFIKPLIVLAGYMAIFFALALLLQESTKRYI